MGASDRIVRHLRLRADSESGVRRAVVQLEDALRCASLPDVDRRVLLVRRLDLGRISAAASSQMLSLLLAQRVAATGSHWVHAADASAADANCIFFHDALEARCQLAQQLVAGLVCAAWYWPLAVPEYTPVEGARANLRNIALSIAALPEAPAALPVWVAHVIAAGGGAAFVEAIGAVDAAALLRAAGLSANTSLLQKMHAAIEGPFPSASGERVAHRADVSAHRAVSPGFTALPAWLQTLALAGGYVPSVVFVTPTQHVADAPNASRPGSSTVEDIGPLHADELYADDETAAAPAFHVDDNGLGFLAQPVAPAQVGHGVTSESDEAIPARVETVSPSRLNGWPYRHPVPGVCGGLLFLLPVLQRLGYETWAAHLPADLPAGVAIRVLHGVLALTLQHMRVPSDDPAWLLVGDGIAECEFGSAHIEPAASWATPLLAPPRGRPGGDIMTIASHARSVAAFSHIWFTACRRWLRRVAHMGVASLVMRPASIGSTATHADVFFRLNDVDMRVRRAGLDSNPGWMACYGRVVTFHYDLQEYA